MVAFFEYCTVLRCIICWPMSLFSFVVMRRLLRWCPHQRSLRCCPPQRLLRCCPCQRLWRCLHPLLRWWRYLHCLPGEVQKLRVQSSTLPESKYLCSWRKGKWALWLGCKMENYVLLIKMFCVVVPLRKNGQRRIIEVSISSLFSIDIST